MPDYEAVKATTGLRGPPSAHVAAGRTVVVSLAVHRAASQGRCCPPVGSGTGGASAPGGPCCAPSSSWSSGCTGGSRLPPRCRRARTRISQPVGVGVRGDRAAEVGEVEQGVGGGVVGAVLVSGHHHPAHRVVERILARVVRSVVGPVGPPPGRSRSPPRAPRAPRPPSPSAPGCSTPQATS